MTNYNWTLKLKRENAKHVANVAQEQQLVLLFWSKISSSSWYLLCPSCHYKPLPGQINDIDYILGVALVQMTDLMLSLYLVA